MPQFKDLSPQEQEAARLALAFALRELPPIGPPLTDDAEDLFRAGWLAGRMWLMDHLVAISAESKDAIADALKLTGRKSE